MHNASHRAATATLALALLAACGGKSTPTPTPGPLELACALSMSGPDPVVTVVGRATTTAGPGAAPVAVSLSFLPAGQTLTLSPPGWVGQGEYRPHSGATGMSVQGQATIDGRSVSASCTATNRLALFTARATATATGADLAWEPVPGAVRYRWTLREGTAGPVVASAETTATSASVTAALLAGSTYVLEVGAYSLTGTETSFPTPLVPPAASFARTPITAGRSGGDGVSAWQLFGPGDYVGDTLQVGFPALASGERLAVLLANAGGDDGGSASVSVVGTGAASLAAPTPLLAAMAGGGTGRPAAAEEAFDRSAARRGEALVSAFREETIARLRDGRLQRVTAAPPPGQRLLAAAAALPATRSFCQARWSDTGTTMVWRSATLAHETAHAAFYYADEVKPGIDAAVAARTPLAPAGQAPFWGELGAAFETRVYPALTTYFGPMSDVDGNGKVIFLLADLGKQAGAFVMGYFSPSDIELAAATATSCQLGMGGNRADMLVLLDPGHFTTYLGGTGSNYDPALQAIVEGDYPGVMAHELQHDVNYNTHCPAGAACSLDEELWLNEGLSMLSETVAGYGLHDASGRASVRSYQGGTDGKSGLPYYQAYGMTIWQGDPTGNYAGVQAYMQYLLDHASPALTQALHNRWQAGKANVEAATGEPWEVGFSRFITAAMFSNEDTAEPNGALGAITSAGSRLAAPAFNFLGDGVAADYVPWHRYVGYCTSGGVQTPKDRTAYVAFTPLSPGASASATLRRDGWAAFATGPGTGGAATIRVQSLASSRPHVVVVKYAGALPNYVAPTCP